jgi:hypothetical protein
MVVAVLMLVNSVFVLFTFAVRGPDSAPKGMSLNDYFNLVTTLNSGAFTFVFSSIGLYGISKFRYCWVYVYMLYLVGFLICMYLGVLKLFSSLGFISDLVCLNRYRCKCGGDGVGIRLLL